MLSYRLHGEKMRWQSKNEVKINAERGGKAPQKEETR